VRTFINFLKQQPTLKKFWPVIEALDEFLYGTDKVTTSSPHVLDRIDIKRYMMFVIFALLPATLAGIYIYGGRILLVIAVSYIFGGLTEVIFAMVRKKQIHEGFLVTGLIFPLILPPTIPLWMVAVGVIFGVFFGKEVFGGTGRNIFNPALVGRIFLSVAFPQQLAARFQLPFVDAFTSATPLISFKSSHVVADWYSLLMGATPGSIGETFRLGILLGGFFLILTKIVDWRIPLSFLLSATVLSWLGSIIFPLTVAPPVFTLLSGGLLFGAFFMATDPVTSPLTIEGRWIYGMLLGILTIIIRSFSGFAEGVMFAILLGNACSPLIDWIIVNSKFGDKYGGKD